MTITVVLEARIPLALADGSVNMPSLQIFYSKMIKYNWYHVLFFAWRRYEKIKFTPFTQ